MMNFFIYFFVVGRYQPHSINDCLIDTSLIQFYFLGGDDGEIVDDNDDAGSDQDFVG